MFWKPTVLESTSSCPSANNGEGNDKNLSLPLSSLRASAVIIVLVLPSFKTLGPVLDMWSCPLAQSIISVEINWRQIVFSKYCPPFFLICSRQKVISFHILNKANVCPRMDLITSNLRPFLQRFLKGTEMAFLMWKCFWLRAWTMPI